MATSVLYRKSSGEVKKISTKGQVFPHINITVFEYLIDPSLPDGTQNLERLDDILGPSRQLGFQKIAIPASNLVRNATQEEIDTFAGFELEDNNQLDANGAVAFLENHPRFRKIFVGILKLLVDQLLEKSNVKQNEMITQWNSFKSGIASANNLADIKSGVAGLPVITADLPDTATLIQIKDQLKAMISKDD